MVPSRSTIAPFGLFWFLRVWRLIILIPSTMTRLFFVKTSMILPRLPRSAPAITTTSSPFLTCCFGISSKFLFACSDHFRSQRNNLHKLLVAQLAGDRPENTRPARIIFLIDDHNRVVIETQIRTIGTANRLARAHHHRVHHFALFHGPVRRGFFDVRFDYLANAGVLLVASQHADRPGALGPGIVGNV